MVKAVIRLFAVVLLLASGAARAEDATVANIDQVMGRADAPLTVIEYASLTCPHCAHFHETVVPLIKSNWVDTGKIRFIYRDFPTSPAGLSLSASMVAQCAGKDRYFAVLGLLFKQQEKWVTATNPKDEIKRIVRLAGITSDDVDACLTRRDLLTALQDRAKAGNTEFGVDSTPSLVIDGKVYPGAQSYEDISKMLDEAYRAALKKAGK